MDHEQAQATHATERYLLGEMDEPERFDFEGHFFACEVCAEDLRAAGALIRGIQAVHREQAKQSPDRSPAALDAPARRWFGWLFPGKLIPTAAAAALAVVAGYQGLVLVPHLRWAADNHALAPTVLRAATRGDEPAVAIDRSQAVSVLAMDVNGADPGASLHYELISPKGPSGIQGDAVTPPPGSPLLLIVQNTDFRETGTWTVVLHSRHRLDPGFRETGAADIGRYPFNVQFK